MCFIQKQRKFILSFGSLFYYGIRYGKTFATNRYETIMFFFAIQGNNGTRNRWQTSDMFLGNVGNNGPRTFLFGTIYKDIDALCKQFVAVDNIINIGMFVFTQLRRIENDFYWWSCRQIFWYSKYIIPFIFLLEHNTNVDNSEIKILQ